MDQTSKKPQLLKKPPLRIPTNGTFELTVRCNLHCKMCMFLHDDAENTAIRAKELTAAQWIDLARQAAEAGTIQLLITGGEPLLRPDFCEIWEGIYQQGFLLELYTNATLVTPRIMETLRKYPPHKIGITIYGASPETYQKVCGSSHAFEAMMKGTRQLQTLPSTLEFRTTIIKDNYPEASQIESLVHTEFGATYKLIQTRSVTKAVRGGCADVEACRLDPEDNVRLAFRRGIDIIKQYVGDSYDERNLRAEYVEQSHDKAYNPRLSLFGCDAGMSSYTVSWDGNLLACQMLGLFAISVLENSFQQAWNHFPAGVKLPPVNPRCSACENVDICNCCYASRYAETGDLGGCPDYVCKDTAIINRLLKTGGI